MMFVEEYVADIMLAVHENEVGAIVLNDSRSG
jgi:hypothetical protein